jgi:purine-binding chemotaxis protein CheW
MTAPTATEPTTSGFVTFRIGDREYATALHEVREIVRLEAISVLPGMAEHMAGVVELRGAPLPVMDLRTAAQRSSDGRAGDVVVLADGNGVSTGIAVDSVVAVRAADELMLADDATTVGLPAYVIDVLRDTVTGAPVLMVDLHRMLDALH